MKTFIFYCTNLDQGYKTSKTITAKTLALAKRQFNRDYDNLRIDKTIQIR